MALTAGTPRLTSPAPTAGLGRRHRTGGERRLVRGNVAQEVVAIRLAKQIPREHVGYRRRRVGDRDLPSQCGVGQNGPVLGLLEDEVADEASWPEPQVQTCTDTSRYGTAAATGWDRLHPRLTHRTGWADHEGKLPIIEGTLVRLVVDHLPGDRDPKPVWLWSSATGATAAEVDRLWQAFLRRFDLEHTFRFWKQTLGWTRPKIRSPEAADRWTWLIIACHTQLRLARHLADDIRRPWERPAPPGRLTPVRVRRGYRNLHRKLPVLTRAPPAYPGPGRPPGRKNHRQAAHQNVDKYHKTDTR